MTKADTEKMDFFEKVGYVFSLWNESWNAFKLNVWTFIALYIIPILLITMLMTFYLLPVLADANDKSVLTAGSAIVAILVTIFAAFVYLLLIPALTVTQLESAKGNTISINEAFNKSVKYLLQYLLAAFVGFFIVVGPLLISMLLFIVLIGFLLFPFALAWAVVGAVFLIFVPYIIVNENIGAIDAIKRSIELTKKKWQWVLAVFVVTALISLASSIPFIGWMISIVLGIIYLCLPALVYVRHIAENGGAVAAKIDTLKEVAPAKNKSKATKKKPASK